jgi:hypothetical protein
MLNVKQVRAFLKKSAAKNFYNLDLGRFNATGPADQKFFGSFFQKRTASSFEDFSR